MDTTIGATRPASTTRGRLRRPVHRPNEDRVVLIDVDGVLADLSAYETVLADKETPSAERWRTFFDHVPDALVLDIGYDVAWAIDGLGYTVVYSTTRPAYALGSTRTWLADHGLPEGRALLGRSAFETNPHARQPWQVKLAHAAAVTNRHPAWLRGFVDDEKDVVRRLTELGVPAYDSDTLAQLGVASLRSLLNTVTQHATVSN